MENRNLLQNLLSLLCCLFLFTSSQAQGISLSDEWRKDHLFPGHARSTIQVGTGIPFAGYAEYSYGITNRFTVGAFYGKNPVSGVYAIGVRFRGVIYQEEEDLRVYTEIPVLIYPKTKVNNLEPWFLIVPNVLIEKKFKSGLRLSFGPGLVGVGCVDAVFGEDEAEHAQSEHHPKSIFSDQGGVMAGVWYTINSGVAFPISNKLMFEGKFNIVGGSVTAFGLDKKNWFYSVPVISVVGLSYTL